MKPFKWLFVLISVLGSIEGFTLDAEHIVWDKTPIHLSISLTEERLVHFPQAISIIDNEAGDKITVLKIQDALYLKGKEAFANKRLLVQLMPQGEVIILNLSANESNASNKAVEIVLEHKEEANQQQEPANSFEINAITLTRFAIQSLYAPQRLLVIPEGVGRIPMQTRRQINLIYGANMESRPLISWHGGALYLTAVELKNLLNKEVVIDPRRIIGNWQTATFYPTNTLAPREKEDTTTVFLVSDRPFNEALATGREFGR